MRGVLGKGKVMSQELVLASSVRAVGTAVAEVVKTYRLSRTYNRAELEALNDRIAETRALVGAQRRGRIIRANIEELAATQQLIDSLGMTGYGLEMAMDQLRSLSSALKRNFEEYCRA